MQSSGNDNILLGLWAGLLTLLTGWNHISIRGQGKDLISEVRRCNEKHITREDFKTSMDRLENIVNKFSDNVESLTKELMGLSINYHRDKEENK